VTTAAIVQARTGSTRLPGKVLLPLLGRPMLSQVMRRVARARLVDEELVATTELASDDPIVELGRREGWRVVRGSEMDLLARYLDAAHAVGADEIVRITSDCPLIDPVLIDDVIAAFRRDGSDYASNTLEPRTYPRGLDVEVVSLAVLEAAGRDDTDPATREHATLFVRRHPERFRQTRVASPADHSALRWTVDTTEDYELVRRICEAAGRDDFGWLDALAIVQANPDWADLNSAVEQKALPHA